MRRHLERHRTGKAGWLRAAVLGADDGILSTASLMFRAWLDPDLATPDFGELLQEVFEIETVRDPR